MEPILNEARANALLPGAGAEPVLQGCQWARDAKPRLSDHDADSREMQQAEGEGVYPTPANKVADDNQDQAAHYEEDDREVEGKDEIREEGGHAAMLDCDGRIAR